VDFFQQNSEICKEKWCIRISLHKEKQKKLREISIIFSIILVLHSKGTLYQMWIFFQQKCQTLKEKYFLHISLRRKKSKRQKKRDIDFFPRLFSFFTLRALTNRYGYFPAEMSNIKGEVLPPYLPS
jgi:hypothetical protein